MKIAVLKLKTLNDYINCWFFITHEKEAVVPSSLQRSCPEKITCVTGTAQKMKFSMDFFSKCDLIRRNLWIRSHLLKKSLMENFVFSALRVPF